MVPHATTVAYLSGPSSSFTFEEEASEIRKAGRALGREIIVIPVRNAFEFEEPLEIFVQRGAGALVVGTFPWFFERRDKLLALAAHHKIPAIYPSPSFVFEGGLMTYGAGRDALHQVGSHYVGQLLNGAKPSDLPVQQPTKFELMAWSPALPVSTTFGACTLAGFTVITEEIAGSTWAWRRLSHSPG